MADKTREVYKDKADIIPELNPFVEMPRMRVDAINRLNEIIRRDRAMPIVQINRATYKYWKCPVCGEVYSVLPSNFCRECGQRLDTDNLAF